MKCPENIRWWIPAVVEGDSMVPVLWPGMVVLLEPASTGGIPEPGDVAAFRTNKGLVIHRVLENQGSGWITRGDRSGTDDPVLPEFSLVGTLRIALRSGAGAYVPRGWVGSIYRWAGLRVRNLPARVLGVHSWPLFWRKLASFEGNRGELMERYRKQRVGKDVAVYDSETGDVHVLNESALTVWNLLQKGGVFDDAVAVLANTYPDYPVESVRRDTLEVIRQLEALGLLTPTEEDTGKT